MVSLLNRGTFNSSCKSQSGIWKLSQPLQLQLQLELTKQSHKCHLAGFVHLIYEWWWKYNMKGERMTKYKLTSSSVGDIFDHCSLVRSYKDGKNLTSTKWKSVFNIKLRGNFAMERLCKVAKRRFFARIFEMCIHFIISGREWQERAEKT